MTHVFKIGELKLIKPFAQRHDLSCKQRALNSSKFLTKIQVCESLVTFVKRNPAIEMILTIILFCLINLLRNLNKYQVSLDAWCRRLSNLDDDFENLHIKATNTTKALKCSKIIIRN